MQAPQRERGVAHPAVAVVPVALAVRRLRQRGRRRRHERAGGHERQALQRERRALEVIAPGVVGIGAFGQPPAPEVAGALQVLLGLLDRAGAAEPLRPGDRAEAPLAFAHRVTGVHAVALDPHAHVAEQAKLGPPVARVEARARPRSRCPPRSTSPASSRTGASARRPSRPAPRPGCIRSPARAGGRRRSRWARACGWSPPCCRATRRSSARPPPAASPGGSSRSSRSGSCPGCSAGRRARTRRRDQRASCRRRDRASRRTRSASRSGAGTSTRSSRRRRPARRCGSPTGSRSRRSAEMASRARTRPAERSTEAFRAAGGADSACFLADLSAARGCSRSPNAEACSPNGSGGPLHAGGQQPLILELVEVRAQRDGGDGAQLGGHVRPRGVEQLGGRAAPRGERRQQQPLALQAMIDVLVELRAGIPDRGAVTWAEDIEVERSRSPRKPSR